MFYNLCQLSAIWQTQLPSDSSVLFRSWSSWLCGKWTFLREPLSAARGSGGAVQVVVLMPLLPWGSNHELFCRGVQLCADQKETWLLQVMGLWASLSLDQVPAAGTADALTLALGNFVFMNCLNIQNNYWAYLFSYLCCSTQRANWRVCAALHQRRADRSTAPALRYQFTHPCLGFLLGTVPAVNSLHDASRKVATELSELGLGGWTMCIPFEGKCFAILSAYGAGFIKALSICFRILLEENP